MNQFAAKKQGFVSEEEVKIKKKEMERALRKFNYRYKPRADMPFWYDWDPKHFKEKLNDDSMLSIDDEYDPEVGIELNHFVLISRLVKYKENFIKYLQMNKSSLKTELVE